ncbi:class I SAM-dependent methyltransferase [Paenibacillus aceris]|uniref:SAM-dependent MidA family methyltransferase n=1 Tax=Paenibacillus aceris TaxID=869555 RepID=A0ABS4HS18_9BACL|nr:SAM-dependent methyltransferase [Paenibacillus aceris]MBP1961412.1 SAM-dependent MidA family methyltransferase [Paenibacillus aceris]NHW37808.1 SAM-dependent methyltransferase [Paenibacillus aceris]
MNVQLGHPEVVASIIQAIQSAGKKAISFRDYMELCLYSEPFGYYRNENLKIGKEGDFYTSSSIGSVMGEMIASFISGQMQQQTELSGTEPLHLVEWGGGNGRMALHLLDELKRSFPAVYDRLSYTIIESSGFHRALQQTALEAHTQLIQFASEQEWMAQEPQDHMFIVANELLDAFPVHRIRYNADCFEESYVTWQEQDQTFAEIWLPNLSKHLLDTLARSKVQWLEGQIGELNLGSESWISCVSQRMKSGSCIIIDYGDVEDELYAAHRYQGTLMCYRKHQAHDNPWIYVGEQDVTSHVNFSALEIAARQSGFPYCKLQTQREFLVEQGILERLQNHYDPNPFSEVSKRNRAIRQLLLSDQMSELFKVFIAVK